VVDTDGQVERGERDPRPRDHTQEPDQVGHDGEGLSVAFLGGAHVSIMLREGAASARDHL
jgi:hypothetical protein